jgi:hypothetical protein
MPEPGHIPSAQIHTVKLWLKSFIPRDIDSAVPVPGGPHAGKTMLPTPGPVNACFLTDQRGFSDDIHASARLHSEIEIDVTGRKMLREYHECFETIQVDRETGEELCRKHSSTERMKFDDFKAAEVDGCLTLTVVLNAASKNPCLEIASIKVSPNVDLSGTLTVALRDAGQAALVAFDGVIETYPAFEMYVSVNGGPAQTVFREDVVPDATPANLVGPPSRSLARQITVSA